MAARASVKKKTPARKRAPAALRSRRVSAPRSSKQRPPAAAHRPSTAPITLRGAFEEKPADTLLKTRDVAVRTKGQLLPASRGVAEAQDLVADPNDVVEIEFAEGQRVWMRLDDYRQQFQPQATRGADSDILLVPESLNVLPAALQTRGPVAWVVKSLKILGVDLSGMTATAIAHAVESRTSPRRPGLGLFFCNLETGRFALRPARLPQAEAAAQGKPWLLFLHGTGSSTWGSFGDLWEASRAAELQGLHKAYPEHALAFEHPTLATSPLQNAVEVARQLPANAQIHIVSHSRGGLVGELLCRAAAKEPFTAEEIAALARDERYAQAGPDGESELAWLQELDKVLRQKRFKVTRYARVACPALGTTLASGRLDRWLSVIGSVAGTALPDTPMAEAFSDLGDFVAAVVQQRTDPRTLPGLEAMMPDSGLIRLVNWPRTTLSGDLTVIAGDIEPDAWWAKLLVWMTDRFYAGDHDLIVNTPSMYGGVKREGAALKSDHKGPSVNHFTYFRNGDSAASMLRALTRDEADTSGFEPLTPPTDEIARSIEAKTRAVVISGAPRPVVIVLPGIMGSELIVGKDRVWIDLLDLALGGLEKLAIDARNVTAFQPIVRYYGDLQLYLADSHKVVAFPFDWRVKPEAEADRLADLVRAELKSATAKGMPVRIVAHSMGGLIARVMIGRHPQLWAEVCQHPGARLLMLGTPNDGSHAITELLVGQSSTLHSLATLDVNHSLRTLLSIVSRFPGVLAMLPKDTDRDWFSPGTWAQFHGRAGDDWVAPTAQDLAGARALREFLDSDGKVDTPHTLYVAGNADQTVAGMVFDEASGEIRFKGTTRGDGRVTWDSGIPPGVPTWYMDVEHGDLCAYKPAFPAIQQLLQTGRTSLLPQTPRAARTVAAEMFDLPRAADVLYPSQESFEASVLGAGSRKHRSTRRQVGPPVAVCVVHGNLKFSRHVVAVGHYEGDGIASAEKALDIALDRQLSRRHGLGLYPGRLETSALFVNPAARSSEWAIPRGALVVGLGLPGSLSAQSLLTSFSRALLDYVVAWEERYASDGASNTDQGLGVSALLIGTAAGGINVPDAVYAMLVAVDQANRTLAAGDHKARIRELEFVELWEDRALEAMRALRQVTSDPELQGRFDLRPTLVNATGRRTRRTYEEPPGWWHRVQILGGTDPGEPLRFAATTRRARSEVRLHPTQRQLVDRFVQDAIGSAQDNREVSRTLFELLLPNELKDQAPDRDDIVLIVDPAAAAYPWELMEDPAGRGEPFVIRHGLLRQLETREFRENVQDTTDLTALVIGDPQTPYRELPGARREAEEVTKALTSHGKVAVEKRVRPTGDEVIKALFQRPYRILHLAAHGVYQFPRPASSTASDAVPAQANPVADAKRELVTGMVIGADQFLTALEIQQMRRVPELAFVNCCHLGRIEAGQEAARPGASQYNRIAANLATELINIGVRVVVAAGWEVDDGAALTFSTQFYTQMLAGATFGEAVKRARRETYDRHPTTNTWGAYQCYGDPDFRLVREAARDETPGDETTFASAVQAAAEIDDVKATLSTAAGTGPRWQVAKLDRIVSELSRLGWLDEGRIRVALGGAYGDALRFEQAVEHYRHTFEHTPSAMSAKDIEQMANLISRAAVASWAAAPASRRDAARRSGCAAIEHAIELINWLMNPPAPAAGARAPARAGGPGTTVERLSLLGSAYKRMAWIGADLPHSLERMQEAYDRALKLMQDPRGGDTYPLHNVLFGQVVLEWAAHTAHSALRAEELERGLAPVREQLAARIRDRKVFWDVVMCVDADLLVALVAGTAADPAVLSALARDYLRARELASPREFASVTDQIDFLREMAQRYRPDVVAPLLALSKALSDSGSEPAQAEPEPAPVPAPKAVPAGARAKKRKGAPARPKRRKSTATYS